MVYAVHELLVEKLQKKATRIRNKCAKYGCDFRFEIVGEEFREETDEFGGKQIERYVLVDCEGIAKLTDWQFVARVDAVVTENEIKNVFKMMTEDKIPERYHDMPLMCEHCGRGRHLKQAYIVHNLKTGEWKIVGRNCLADFTHGLNIETAASWINFADEVSNCNISMGGGKEWYETKIWLSYVAEIVNKFGYVKAYDDFGCVNLNATKLRVLDYWGYDHNRVDKYTAERLMNEIRKYDLVFDRPENEIIVENAIKWALSQELDSTYMHNLKTLCSTKYVEARHLGILTSLIPVYFKSIEQELEYKKRLEAEARQKAESGFVGQVGQRLKFEIADYRVVTGFETQYGWTNIYKILDKDNNVYIWKTSNYIDDDDTYITGTVKEHSEYRGVKQTVLTRCRVS